MIVFTTDHGAPFPHHKCTLSDTGIGVSLIVQLPGHAAAGKIVDALVSHLDLFPTLCELVGLPAPEWLEGHSLVPLLTGEKERIRTEIFAELNDHVVYQPMRCVRTERFKLVTHHGDQSSKLGNIDAGRSKACLLSRGLTETREDFWVLYDLQLDPGEHQNLAESNAHQEILSTLKDKLKHWMMRTNDPEYSFRFG